MTAGTVTAPIPRTTQPAGGDYDLTFREQIHLFRRFLVYLHPYRDKVVLGILLMFVGVPIGQTGSYINRYLWDKVLLSYDRPTDQRLSMFFGIVGLQMVMWLVSHSFSVIRQILGWYIDMRVSLDLRKAFYDHLQRLSVDFFRERPIGEHMYRTTADIGSGVVTMIVRTVPDIVDIIYNVIWGAILLSLVDPWLTFLVICWLMPFTVGAQYFYGRLRQVSFEVKRRQQIEVSVLRDGIAGAKTVKGSGRIKYQVLKYLSRVIQTRRANLRYLYLNILANDGVLWTMRWVFDKWIWFYVTYQVMDGTRTIGEWGVTFWLLGQFKHPMERLIRLTQDLRLQMVPAQRLLETMDVEPEIVDPPAAVALPRLSARIEFRNVDFAYEPGKPVLQDVTFTLEPGMTAAFVGPSGAGKSTIMHLVLRLHDPTSGRVLVDGQDLKRVALQSYLEQVAVVPQTTFLFGCNVGDNIRYGRLEATDEEVCQAAALAEIDGFITQLPQGYDTYLGEGTKLSGGQKQRIGIARALIRDPRVLILDEATASLDARAEEAILRTIEKVRKGRTVLTIAHRLRAVVDADVIFVLQDGRIVDQGTHEKLMDHPGVYREMWDEQTRMREAGLRLAGAAH
jgi:ABC-type multidrug transport system fused ATPase/permease subunit